MSLLEKQSAPVVQVRVREFQPGDEPAFRKLNEEWISRFFRIEPKDEEAFKDPAGKILDRGGKIFFATVAGQYVGCCALLRMSDKEYEVAKMAVTPECQGSGIGRKLLQAVIEAGRIAGAQRLYLETNKKLERAIRLYESMGFKHLPPDRETSSPYARADVYMEMTIQS